MSHDLEALHIANQAVNRWPNSADTALLRARILAKLPDRVNESVADYNRAIALIGKARPELLIERADTQISIGVSGYEPALAQLAQRRAMHGFLYVLQHKAFQITRKAGLIDDAVAIATDISQHMNRRETWLKTIGDLLMQQGKIEAAKQYYQQALKSIEDLSDRQRQHPDVIHLKCQLFQLTASSNKPYMF